MMTAPFLTLPLRRKRDVLSARQKARRVANLLGYQTHEQACITAGAFMVASQALALFGKAVLCFQIEDRQLNIFAQEVKRESASTANRITHLVDETNVKTLYRLTKPLPAEQSHDLADKDLGWLINTVADTAPDHLFEEVEKQNQEILMLLSELRLCRPPLPRTEEKIQNPHAA
jgi:hypothetical protein